MGIRQRRTNLVPRGGRRMNTCNYCAQEIRKGQHRKTSQADYVYHATCYKILRDNDPEFKG